MGLELEINELEKVAAAENEEYEAVCGEQKRNQCEYHELHAEMQQINEQELTEELQSTKEQLEKLLKEIEELRLVEKNNEKLVSVELQKQQDLLPELSRQMDFEKTLSEEILAQLEGQRSEMEQRERDVRAAEISLEKYRTTYEEKNEILAATL